MCAVSSLSVPEEPLPLSPQHSRPTHLQTYLSNRTRLYPEVTDEQWNDWKWQQKNRVTTLAELSALFPFDELTAARLGDIFELYRTAITPYYLCLIDFDNPNENGVMLVRCRWKPFDKKPTTTSSVPALKLVPAP